jgi:hypothetical protein
MSNEVKPEPGSEERRPPLPMNVFLRRIKKSRPWGYKAMRAGKLRYIMIGSSRYITAAEADRIENEGLELRPADAPPHGRYRFPRKNEEYRAA